MWRQWLPPSLFLASTGNGLCNDFQDLFCSTTTPRNGDDHASLELSQIVTNPDRKAGIGARDERILWAGFTGWICLRKLSPTPPAIHYATTEAWSETADGGPPKLQLKSQLAGISRVVSNATGSLSRL